MNFQKEDYGLEGIDTFMTLVMLARLPSKTRLNLCTHSIILKETEAVLLATVFLLPFRIGN